MFAAGFSTPGIVTMAYLGAGILFILSLGGLAQQETSRRGNTYGVIGMVIALAATLYLILSRGGYDVTSYGLLAGAIGVGAVIGTVLAVRVQMTAMPQLVALLHSFVGLAAVLVGLASYLNHTPTNIHSIEVHIDVAIGALTFTGSIVAWVKLRGKLFGKWVSGKPLLLPGRHFINLALVIAIIALAFPIVSYAADGVTGFGFTMLCVMSVISGILGVHLVLAIGGADMPVVVSLLNSYSGWTAAAAGFMLENDLLIITGALVGSSGAILSYIMCEAMNRSIWNVVFGGFGATPPKSSGPQVQGEFVEIETEELASTLKDAKNVIIVPGYGMAVAQAQRSVDTFTRKLISRGVNVRFAIHPVAGRLPGHMNVLLAEAGVNYDFVLEMEEINEDFPETDVVMVIGANDIVNPAAQTDPGSPIAGMPVLEAWKAALTVVLKRGRGKGYAGIVNPLFFKEKTRMYFGDARDSIDKLNAEL